MNFKKLEIYGFKSFADKLNIEFGEGITAIVGPNGCGKSNVADAIRWALGEQSAKTLRGAQMNDVIFNGTEKRRSLSYCEVLLYFDNSAKIFDSTYNEIVISRKLYRDGTSEYCMNKQPCRLKDITAILHNSGLGRDGYAIIGQGRIDEILSVKAEDRRAIFEDAAGISKFKQVKLENERKLERVTEKLIRVTDIISELEKQVEPLGRQAEVARQCYILKENLRILDVNSFLYQYETADSSREAVRNKLKGISEEFAIRQAESDKASERYLSAQEKVASIDNSIKELNAEQLSLNIKLEQRAGEAKVMETKLIGLKEQNEILTAQNEKLNRDFDVHNQQVSELSQEKTEKMGEISVLKREVDELSASFLAVSGVLAKNENEVVSTHKRIVETMDNLSDIKAKKSKLQTEKAGLEDRIEYCSNAIESLKAQSAKEKGEADLLNIELEQNKLKLDSIRVLETKTISEYNETLVHIKNTSASLEQAHKTFHSLSTKLSMYQTMQKEMTGYQYPVKKLMQDSKSNKELSSRIEGVVANLIKVSPKLETAIEMSLGNAIQNIVTPIEDDAKFLIQYLKKSLYGRATFLPINAVKPRYLENEYSAFLSYNGCYGIACDLIQYDKKYENIFRGLLGKTVITDTIDTAVKIARDSNYGFKIVTLEGDIINPHGSYTGGSKKETSNLLGLDRDIEVLERKLKESESEVASQTEKRALLQKNQDKLQADISSLNEKKHALELVVATQKEKILKINHNLEENKKQNFGLDSDVNKIFVRISEIDAEIADVDRLEIEINSRKNAADSSNEQNTKQFDVLRKNRDELHGKLTAAKVKLASVETEFNNIEAQIARLKSEILAICSDIDANKSQIERNNSAIRAFDVVPIEINETGETEMRERLKEVEAKLNSLDEYKQSCQDEFTKSDEERTLAQSRLAQLSEARFKEELQLTQINDKLEFFASKITEEYQLDYESCLKFRVDNFDLNTGMTEANKLRKEILKLGNVNMNAIEDYERLKERYDKELAEKTDLEKSMNDTKLIIKDMTKEMLAIFNEQFVLIKKYFVQTFKSLFGGGNADLIIEDSDNPLESGIEIVAEPPGKKLQSISLLSGGERALTAIAILFAILKLRPMPFCVLDEIEAALDDANAERFAKYLHNFSERTQFIVITHRKPTMELADSLYGVTMEEKGISKMVSVKLSEAVKNVDEGA